MLHRITLLASTASGHRRGRPPNPYMVGPHPYRLPVTSLSKKLRHNLRIGNSDLQVTTPIISAHHVIHPESTSIMTIIKAINPIRCDFTPSVSRTAQFQSDSTTLVTTTVNGSLSAERETSTISNKTFPRLIEIANLIKWYQYEMFIGRNLVSTNRSIDSKSRGEMDIRKLRARTNSKARNTKNSESQEQPVNTPGTTVEQDEDEQRRLHARLKHSDCDVSMAYTGATYFKVL